MADQSFGKFKSVEEFLESFERRQAEEEEEALGLEGRRRWPPRQARQREVAELFGVLRVREAEDTKVPKHHLLLTVNEIIDATVRVQKDLTRAIDAGEDVFMVVRFGDWMGITETIEGLLSVARINVQGEWITRQQATDRGRRDMAVLHFTHDPLGFICVGDPELCYFLAPVASTRVFAPSAAERDSALATDVWRL
jgi:endonuclease G